MKTSLQHLQSLIAFPTISRDSNLALIHYVRDFLASLQIESDIVASPDGHKANLWATIGPRDVPGIVLSGHSDVVPVAGQSWSSDPFSLTERDGRLFGRGTADMKGFIACCLHAIEAASKQKLTVPIHLALSYDEEVGCIGVRSLLHFLKDISPKPRLCIVGEPTLMQAITAHKGKVSFRAVAHGLEAHSSLSPQGANAIYMASDLIGAIRSIQRDIAAKFQQDDDYDVPYTTLHVGKIFGGEVLNIVPNECSFDFEIRFLPSDDAGAITSRIRQAADDISAEYKAVFPDARIELIELQSYPALSTPVDSEAVKFVHALTGGNSTGKISFGTEAGLFQEKLDIPAIVCGPGHIAVAHKPDEYITADQMARCDSMLKRLLEILSR